jgi:hypothetical protein
VSGRLACALSSTSASIQGSQCITHRRLGQAAARPFRVMQFCLPHLPPIACASCLWLSLCVHDAAITLGASVGDLSSLPVVPREVEERCGEARRARILPVQTSEQCRRRDEREGEDKGGE